MDARLAPAVGEPAAAPGARRIADVPVLLQVGMHLLIAALLLLTVVRAATSDTGSTAAVIVTAVVLAAIYAAGPAIPAVRRSVGGASIWLSVVLLVWLVLLALSPDAIWLAFPWFFLLLHLLPWRAGLAAVAVTTVAAIGGFAWHQHVLTVGTALGPVLGALVAVATVWGYTAVASESDRRRVLIAELRETRAELAVAERSAGAMAERERLAREIHDTLAQGLSSIQLLLRAAARTLPEDGSAGDEAVAAARLRIEQAREAAQDNLAEARRFVAELAPPDLQGRSLPAALQRLCRTTSERTDLPVRFRVETAGRGDDGARVVLPTPIEVALLRIAQSAVANVTAHSGATSAAVTLTLMDRAVALDIVDDGRGFDPELPPSTQPTETPPATRSTAAGSAAQFTAAPLTAQPTETPPATRSTAAGPAAAGHPATVPTHPSGGFGIPAMRSRVAELGGTLSVESAPGAGTAIAVSFPLPQVEP